MARIVQIQYTLAPQLQAKQWVDDDIRLAQALKPIKKTLRGELSDAAWTKFDSLAWQHKDGVWTLRTDSVPIKAPMRGCVDVTINSMHRVNVAFKMEESHSVWHAQKIYNDPIELLEALRLQTINDFADPRAQDTISAELNKIFTSLYAEWDLPNLEEKFSAYASKIGKLVYEYHSQWQELEWYIRMYNDDPLHSGGYLWHGHSALHHEVLRLLYYITQSFSFLDKKDGSLWVSPATAMAGTLDLSFLQTRLYTASAEQHAGELTYERKQHHPGDADQAKSWLHAVKVFDSDHGGETLTEEALRVIWNTAVVFDYLPRLTPDADIDWSASCVRSFLTDAEYRSDLLKIVPQSALNHKTYLDDAVQFWEHGGYASLGISVRKVTTQALNALRDYFGWKEATAQGLSFPAIPVYKESDITIARRRFKGSDVLKKIEPLLQTLEERGPLKYSAVASDELALDSVAARFPNFKEIIGEIKKQLRLARLQTHPIIKLDPILIVGDPGWGKTRFLKALADALRLPFNEIPMSSVTAGFVLSGGDLMWHSAKHGRIADIFMHGVCVNPMVVLDELDKVTSDDHDPYGPLHQLLESHTAERFTDEALNVPLAAQYISWCATANDISVIPEPIRGRFDIYEIPALTIDETPIVAQSIFDDLVAANLWGPAFDPVLRVEFSRKLHGLNARSMYFALRAACANASARTDRPLVLEPDDLPVRSAKKRSMGF